MRAEGIRVGARYERLPARSIAVVTTAPRFHSLRPAAPFRNAEAIYHEAISNSSPYYRLLLADRGFEGIQQIRRVIRKSAERFNVTDKMPRPLSLDATELAQLDSSGYFE
jgi:hypothetical protein